MNLIEESFETKKEKSSKRMAKIILIVIVILVILIFVIVGYLAYIQNSKLKVSVNGQVNEKVKNLLIIEADGTVYVPIKEIASYLGYESYNGEYSDKSEDTSKCYVQSENEVANFTLNSKKIYKLNLADNANNYEYVYTKKPVKAINGVLCTTTEGMEQAFNVSFQYNQDTNRIAIYTLPYLISSYSGKVLDYGYAEISSEFSNQKAILQDMLVVKKDKNKNIYGVIDTKGNIVLESKYDNITYLSNYNNSNSSTTGDFLVESNKKVGIVSKSKETKVQIIYDNIELMDSDAGLYVVKKDNKYGVIDLKGNIKIYIENDEIGIDNSKFAQNDIKNKYLLVDNLIPVRKDKKWAVYDKSGNLIVDFIYDSFGYIASSNKDAINLLVIPDYNVLVACKDKKYTLVNSSGVQLFQPVADDIYMSISGGSKHYYIVANNNKMDAEEYLDKRGVASTTDGTANTTNTTNTDATNNSTQTQEPTNVESLETTDNIE